MDPYRTHAGRNAADAPSREAAWVEDQVCLAVIFVTGALTAIASFCSDSGATPGAVGMLMVGFAASTFVREGASPRCPKGALRKH